MDAHDPQALARARAALLSADVVCPHDDADGLSAAALALRARGQGAQDALLLAHDQTPWGQAPDLPEDLTIALLDQGVRPFARAGVLIDHHVPETDAAQDGVTVLTSHGEQPETPTAPLTRRVLGDDQPAWLAALGAFGDLGAPGFELPECAGAGRTAVRKLAPLVNAPRRQVGGPLRTALALLVEHDDPRDALADPRIEVLDDARKQARAAFEQVVRTAPRFHGDVAVLRFDVPFRVHPLVATTWARRLKGHPVLAANDGWADGHVAFAVRGGGPQADLRALLRGALPDATGDLGNGHAAATGGRLSPDEFERLLAGLAETTA